MLLSLKNVGKTFSNADEPTLEGISLDIEKGEFVCVVGRSGCGKSTLLNLIAGLEHPTAGEILLNGKPVTTPGADRVVMFQEHALFPWRNVMQNVTFGMEIAGIPKDERTKTAQKYLRMTQLEEYADYLVHQLSGGMRQRVALARALTMNAEVLLMDEPFSSLDKQTSNHLRGELQDIWMQTKQTIFFITHSVEEAVYLADRIVIMAPGRGIADIMEVTLDRPRHVYDDAFMDYRRAILEKVQGDTP